MAKGAIAKKNVVEIISEAFGDNYIGEVDKKYYVWANDGGEQVQIAISLTCPKIQVEKGNIEQSGDWNFEDNKDGNVTTITSPKNSDMIIAQEELNNIANLMEKLGL